MTFTQSLKYIFNHQYVFRLSVIKHIWHKVLFSVLIAVAIFLVDIHYYKFPEAELTFIPIFGMVIGMLLVFRTNTGYERFADGRRNWSKIHHHIRTITRCCWLSIKTDSKGIEKDEKVCQLKLLIAFAYATKNYLRKEYGYDDDPKLAELIKGLPRVWGQHGLRATYGHSISKDEENAKNGRSIQETNNHNVKITVPTEADLNQGGNCSTERISHGNNRIQGPKAKNVSTNNGQSHRSLRPARGKLQQPTNIPLELVYFFHSYFTKLTEGMKFICVSTQRTVLNSLNELTNSLAELERIRNTPIPTSYAIHLHQSLWLYILILPLQLIGKLGWMTIPATALVSFAFFGILKIGALIENPFGYDEDDLPLEEYCEAIEKEVMTVVSSDFPDYHEWSYSIAITQRHQADEEEEMNIK